MDDEKFERQKEFILEQQAQFAAKIGQLEDNLTRLNKAAEQQGENVQRLGESVERLGENVERLVGVVERVVDTISRLVQVTAERFESVEKHGDEADRRIAALVDAQILTEENLRKLSTIVNRHITEGHNGGARPES
jgi:archaellum component FlaC